MFTQIFIHFTLLTFFVLFSLGSIYSGEILFIIFPDLFHTKRKNRYASYLWWEICHLLSLIVASLLIYFHAFSITIYPLLVPIVQISLINAALISIVLIYTKISKSRMIDIKYLLLILTFLPCFLAASFFTFVTNSANQNILIQPMTLLGGFIIAIQLVILTCTFFRACDTKSQEKIDNKTINLVIHEAGIILLLFICILPIGFLRWSPYLLLHIQKFGLCIIWIAASFYFFYMMELKAQAPNAGEKQFRLSFFSFLFLTLSLVYAFYFLHYPYTIFPLKSLIPILSTEHYYPLFDLLFIFSLLYFSPACKFLCLYKNEIKKIIWNLFFAKHIHLPFVRKLRHVIDG